jgi:FkbM family methyltransferase
MNRLIFITRRFLIWSGIDVLISWLCNRFKFGGILIRMMPPPFMYPIPCFRMVVRNGLRLRLDLSQYIDWTSYFCMDPEHKRLVYPHVKEGMIVLDIGSNMGEMALNFAKRTGPSGKVIGFEPVPENYMRCTFNFTMNEFDHLYAENLALGRDSGMLYFDSMPLHNSGGAVLTTTPSKQSVDVNMTSIDAYVLHQKLTKVDFIKIDVEGFEMEVLSGAENALLKYRPMLCVEVNDEHLRRFGSSEDELMDFLARHRYSTRVITPKVLSKTGSWHFDILAEPLPIDVVQS